MHVSYRAHSMLRLALLGTWMIVSVGSDALGDAARKLATACGERYRTRLRRRSP